MNDEESEYKYQDASYANIVNFSGSVTDEILNSGCLPAVEALPNLATISVNSLPKESRKFVNYQHNNVELSDAGKSVAGQPKPYGLKIHVAIDDSNDPNNLIDIEQNNYSNIGQGWNIVCSILDKYQIYLTKIIRKNIVDNGRGKQITIYVLFQLTDRNWENIVIEIERELNFHQIIPDSFSKANNAQEINGARYVNYRYEQRGTRNGLPLNKIPAPNPFANMYVNQEEIAAENYGREQIIRTFLNSNSIRPLEAEAMTEEIENFQRTTGLVIPLWMKKEYGLHVETTTTTVENLEPVEQANQLAQGPILFQRRKTIDQELSIQKNEDNENNERNCCNLSRCNLL